MSFIDDLNELDRVLVEANESTALVPLPHEHEWVEDGREGDSVSYRCTGCPLLRATIETAAPSPKIFHPGQQVIFTPLNTRDAFGPPLLLKHVPYEARYYRRVGKQHWIRLKRPGVCIASVVLDEIEAWEG